MDSKVTIKNISSATIIISMPDLHFRRELMPGRSVSVPKETYDEMSFDSGFISMVEDHYVKVSGLEEEEVAVATENPVYENVEINRMLDALDVSAFAKMIPTAAKAEKDTIVELAIKKGITHPAFVKLIQQYCDVDIIEAINKKHQIGE